MPECEKVLVLEKLSATGKPKHTFEESLEDFCPTAGVRDFWHPL